MPDMFDGLIGPLLAVEGGYVADPRDAGGATNFGITQAVAVANGFTGDMRTLTVEQARGIYRALYWVAPGYDKIGVVSAKVAAELFDTAVNMGISVAGKFLQRSLNVLNAAELLVDGQCGPASVRALNDYITKRGAEGQAVLLRTMNCLQGARYVELAEQRPANMAFEYGWIRNRVAL